MTGNHLTAREFVGREIRQAREAKGLSRAALAKKFPVSESLVAWWESGRTLPADGNLSKLIKILDLPDVIVRIMNDLVSNEVAPEWLGKWISLQAQATSLLTYQSSVIPGLLQIEDYARAILKLTQRGTANLEERVNARMARREILTRDDPPPPLYHVVLDEAVLRRPVGGPKVMGEQLTYVVEMSQRAESSVIVQVIPFSKGEHAGNAGAFTLASFNGREVAYVDNVLRADIVEKPEDVAEIRRVWQMLSSKASPADQSIELIKEVAESWMV